jgi:hypothetical protein
MTLMLMQMQEIDGNRKELIATRKSAVANASTT